MMDLDEKEEEILIKIEYYESEDVDPLNIYSETLNKTGSLVNKVTIFVSCLKPAVLVFCSLNWYFKTIKCM